MNLLQISCTAASLALACGCSQSAKSAADARAADRERGAQELSDSAEVVAAMDQIPTRQRTHARCVVVVPSLVRAGLLVGGRHGDGVVTCRNGSGWSAPLFLTVTGGSAGFQIGVESSDVVMLVMSERGMSKLFRSSFALGADISAAAGPVGQAGQAGTDPSLTAELLTYARSRGLFAGAELSGSSVKQDADTTTAYYGAEADPHAILDGSVRAPKEATAFLAHIAAAFPSEFIASTSF